MSGLRFYTPDKDLFDTFLRGHLSLKSCLYDQILPKIISFCILGTWDENYGIWCFLDDFGQKKRRKQQSRKKHVRKEDLTASRYAL